MTYRIVHEGMGGFLNPPNDPQHNWGVKEGYGENAGRMSLRYALTQDYVPDDIKQAIRVILETNLGTFTQKWEQAVYAYFKDCYAPENGSRAVSDCIIDHSKSIAPERSLAVLHIKQFFPDYKPNLELL